MIAQLRSFFIRSSSRSWRWRVQASGRWPTHRFGPPLKGWRMRGSQCVRRAAARINRDGALARRGFRRQCSRHAVAPHALGFVQSFIRSLDDLLQGLAVYRENRDT